MGQADADDGSSAQDFISDTEDTLTHPSSAAVFAHLLHPDAVSLVAERFGDATKSRSRVVTSRDSNNAPQEHRKKRNPYASAGQQPVIKYIDDAELDSLVRWHKFRLQVYPKSYSDTPVVEPRGSTGWIQRPETWSSINNCRVLAGKSSLEEFCTKRGYKDVIRTSAIEQEDEEGDEASPNLTEEFTANISPRAPLTNAYLRQIILWYREKTSGADPGESTTHPVWLKGEDDAWTAAEDSWKEITLALKQRQRGVETDATSIHDFIASQKPALTPALVLQYLQWSLEKDKKYASSMANKPVYLKENETWVKSFYRWNEIELYIRAHKEEFDASSLGSFKKRHGLSNPIDTSGPGWLKPAFAQEAIADFPKVDLPVPLATEDLKNLALWHEEKCGGSPDETTTTPVWVKMADDTWAHATTTWNTILENLRHEIEELEARDFFNRPHIREQLVIAARTSQPH